jgi:outer membrane protein assembly factor BamA
VQIVEAAQYAVELSAGFGTVECLRTSGRWINRNFIGGGRRLEVLGSVSRIGVGSPTNIGLDRSICAALGEEDFFGLQGFSARDRLDYRIATNLQQPSIFGTQNQLAVNLHSERTSEADAFIRESTGGRIAAVRQLERGPTVITTTFDVELGRTLASPAVICIGFDRCTQEDLDLLRQRRWSNSLSISALHDRTRTEGTSTRGFIVRGGVDWASEILGSDDNYIRLLAEGSRYQPVGRSSVLATNLRLGRFLRGVLGPEQGYIPPERRFYAGGPASVRGYTRNALGPTAYIQLPPVDGEEPAIVGSATGGTQMIVGSTELRMPSPWMSDVLRLAVFVDAGQVTAPGAEFLTPRGIRFTPGAGVRFLTPVGPFRLDVAYNPYPPEAGPLFIVDPEEGLIAADTEYRPDSPGFLGRFRIQFGLGQAF